MLISALSTLSNVSLALFLAKIIDFCEFIDQRKPCLKKSSNLNNALWRSAGLKLQYFFLHFCWTKENQFHKLSLFSVFFLYYVSSLHKLLSLVTSLKGLQLHNETILLCKPFKNLYKENILSFHFNFFSFNKS